MAGNNPGAWRRIFARRRAGRKNRFARLLRLFRRNTLAVHAPGNQVELAENGEALFRVMLAAVESAESEVLAEFYIVRDDATGRRFAGVLSRAAARGVRVCLLYDYVGSFATSSAYFENLSKAGVRCLAFNPPSFRRGFSWFDKRDHRKILVVDGRIAFSGSMNIGDEYVCSGQPRGCWRDVGLSVQGPAARVLAGLFRDLWEREGGVWPWRENGHPADPQGEADVLLVSGGPHFSRSHIRTAFRIAFAEAGESIRIMTPYFLPGPRFIRALLRAAGRGIRVVLVLPEESDVPIVRLASRGLQGQLLAAGIEVYERQGAMLHAKVMVVDAEWGMLGSANLDHRSFHRNFEVNLVVHGGNFGTRLESLVEAELLGCRRLTPEAVEQERGLFTRFLEKLLQPLSWFL